MPDERTPDDFISDLRQQVAMWADESLFGHGLNDDDYESAVDRFADACCGTVLDTLMERPVR